MAAEESAGLQAVARAAIAHPEVADAVALFRADELVAYVVPGSRHLTEAGLRAHLAESLPEFAVPDSVVLVAELPVSTVREELLCALFASVLGVTGVGVDDGFLDLGGHSLQITRLVRRIRSVLGVAVTYPDVLDAPTPRTLAMVLGERPAERGWAPVVRLRAGGTGPPLFVVHPIAGVCLAYTGMVPYLRTGYPVYGLQATPARPDTLAELAEEYAGRICALQPTGPYRLLGWSLGGLIAQAIATRLQALGHEVGLLALVDAYPVADRRPFTGETCDSELAADLALRAGMGAGNGPRELTSLLAEAFDVSHPATEELIDAARHHTRLAAVHTPDPFSGRMIFFAAEDGVLGTRAGGIWQRYVDGPLTVHKTPGQHHTLFRPPGAQCIAQVVESELR